MGLFAHYKLDGNADDAFGKYNGTASNVTWVDGKLGQCGSFNGSNAHIPLPRNKYTMPVGSFSLSFWIKGSSASVTGTRYVFLSGRDMNNSGIGISRVGVSTNYNFFAWIAGTKRSLSFSVANDSWSHLVCSYDANKGATVFVNGTMVASHTYTGSIAYTQMYGSSPSIGSHGGIYFYNGLIDDVRIYDHALSEREVRDLAKGLVLHYTFDQFQEPTENLLYTNGNINWTVSNLTGAVARTTVTTNSVYRITSTTGGSFRIAVPIEKLVSGKEYTLSYRYKFISGGTTFFMTDWCDQALYNVINQSSYSSATGVKATYDGTYRFMDFSISANTAVEIWDFQLEQKPYATPFVNGTRTGIVRNSSTQGNDAPLILSNTPKWVEGGVVGKGCYEFVSNSIDCGNSFHTTKDQTISIWVKPSNFSARRNFYNRNYGGEGTITQETNGALNYFWGTNGSNSSPYQGFNSVTGLILNQWNHVCLVRKLGAGGYLLWYINGVQTASVNPAYTESAKSVSNLILGTGYTTFFNGVLDDVRVYTTALSADEVKELYQQRASLDSRGNLLC